MKMNQKKIDKLYEENKNIIFRKAHSFNKTTGHDLNELISEGHVLFMKAVDTYNEKNKKFSTWLWTILTNGLIRFIKKTDIPNDVCNPDIEQFNLRSEFDPSMKLMFKDTLLNMSDDAKDIISILLSTPTEILDLTGGESARAIRGKIRKHLWAKPDWTWNQIWDAFTEIKVMLRSEI